MRFDRLRLHDFVMRSSGSDHIHADRIAVLLLALTALGSAIFWAAGGPRHRRGTSPAGIAARLTATTLCSIGRFRI